MGFTKILVAVDRSSQAAAVFEQALELAQKNSARLKVLHCVNPQGEGEIAPLMGTGVGLDPAGGKMVRSLQQERLQQEKERARHLLESYCQRAAELGIAAESDCKVGEPGALICEVAKNWPADLIAIGRRGRKGLAEILLGSVSNRVVHNASCSVLIVQGAAPPPVEAKNDS